MRHVALNFHGLGEPHGGVDAEERPYWLSFASFRKIIKQIVDSGSGERVMVTFDDGNASDLQGAEILAEHGLRGFIFPLAGRLGQADYLSASDLRSLVAMGMTIGLHGYDHVDWRNLDDAGLVRETVTARAMLSDAVGQKVDEVAIPLGAYNKRVMHWLDRQDFAHIHTSDQGTFDPAARIWNRNSIRCDMGAPDIGRILAGHQPLVRRLGGLLSQTLRRHVL
jgi:peptidoglycan/xylan/chitin deacetylase (PgdA/CDA1 family)